MDDLISRQAAIDIVVFECGKWTGLAKEICKQIKQLPTTQPERKKGKWKLLLNGDAICSECGHTQKCAWDFDNWDNYCHFCGSDNRGE